MRLAEFRAGVKLVTPWFRRDNDMPGRKDEVILLSPPSQMYTLPVSSS
jgi:hypothetical protein